MATPEEVMRFNQSVQDWRKNTMTDLDKKFDQLDIQHVPRSPNKTPSREALKSYLAYVKSTGMVKYVSFKFPRNMVYVAKGVGKDTPIAKAGSTNRKEKDWFNAVIDEKIDSLADMAADQVGDILVNALKIR